MLRPEKRPPRRPFASSLATASLLAALLGCHHEAGVSSSTEFTGDLAKPVAKVDDTVITVGDLQERINKQAPFVRARYTTPEKKREMLDNVIRFEILAKEASRRGYDKDPDVIRTMKQQMISKFLQKDFDAKIKPEDVPDADVEKYYKEHPEEFNHPDEVRVSAVVVADKGKADKIAAQAKKLPKDDQKAFRDLVMKESEDKDSKARGGDMMFFDVKGTQMPKPAIEAAFALTNTGDVSGPVKTEKGFYILKLTQKRPGFSRSLADSKHQIQQRLFRDMRTKSLEAFITDLKSKAKVEINDDNLAKVTVDTGGGPGPGGPGHPGFPGNLMSPAPGQSQVLLPPAHPAQPPAPPAAKTTP